MVKKTKLGKDRLDKYYHLAKEQGYRSRASFKLIQLNKKYEFLSSARAVVDLCAAPGGWLQVARKYQPITGITIGVDLATIKNIPNVTTFVGDITTQKCVTRIKQELKGIKADVVLNDGSPNVGANWFKDAYSQSELVLSALKLAVSVLRPGGIFVTKVFRSKDYTSVVWIMNQFFDKVEATKPKASRNTSAEIYLVGLNYKAPKDIDPKLFNPNLVFEEVSEQKTLKSIAPNELMKRAKRNREGYDDDAFVLFKKCSVIEFIESQRPISILADFNEIYFDETCQKFFDHPETTKEIKRLCSDLKVLGMADMKLLMKWRVKMRKIKTAGEKMDEDVQNDSDSDGEMERKEPEKIEDIDDVAQLQKELEELKEKQLKLKKNALKRQKIKQAKRQPLPTDMTEKKDDIMDNIPEGQLFTIHSLTDKKALAITTSDLASSDIDKQLVGGVNEEDVHVSDDEQNGSDDDDDESDDEKYDKIIEQQIETIYQSYLERKGLKDKETRSLQKHKKEKEDLYDALSGEKLKLKSSGNSNPLLVEFNDSQNVTASRKTNQWFSQNVFDILKDEEEHSRRKKDEVQNAKKRQRLESGLAKHLSGQRDDSEDEEDDDDLSADEHLDDSDLDDSDLDSDSSDYEELKKQLKETSIAKGGTGAGTSGSSDDISFVPAELHDDDTRATTLALATKLLKKKARQEFVDSAFSRYTFNDEELPEWFEAEETVAHKKELPITKEEVEKMKAKFAEINARPVKKVLEAIYRKKRRAQRKMEKMKEKANVIAASNELTNADKARELQKLYKKVNSSIKPQKVYAVAKKFKKGQTKTKVSEGSVVKHVDKRMKKEKRAQKARDSRKRKR